MTPFTDFRFLYPARPSICVVPTQFDFYERRGHFAQAKMNGTCAIIGLGPNEEIELWNRHNEPLKWDMPRDIQATLRNIAFHRSWTVLVAELLHSKVKDGPKNTIYLFDALVWRGEYLTGHSNWSRYATLLHRCSDFAPKQLNHIPRSPFATALEITKNVWLANAMGPWTGLPGTFREVFQKIEPDGIVEGLVIKNPETKLEPCVRESSNNTGSVKCRMAKKSYSH